MTTLPPRVRSIVLDVATERGLAVDDIMSRSRKRRIAYARFDVWKRLRAMDNPPSFLKIAMMFDRDHTTIIHGVNK